MSEPSPMLNKSARVLVVGATSDIGQALIPALLPYRIQIGLHGCQSMDRLQGYKDDPGQAHVRTFEKHLAGAESAKELLADFLEWAGGIDCLIQLSGNIHNVCNWQDLTPDDWQKDLDINLTGPFFLAQAALRAMSDGGRIVLMSTASAAHGGGPDSFAYSVAKSGVNTLVKGFAKFCAARNILVNAVSPGFIDTRFQTEKAGKSAAQLEARAASIPLGRSGTAEDVAAAILFLISNQNQFITGQSLVIDGGDFL